MRFDESLHIELGGLLMQSVGMIGLVVIPDGDAFSCSLIFLLECIVHKYFCIV